MIFTISLKYIDQHGMRMLLYTSIHVQRQIPEYSAINLDINAHVYCRDIPIGSSDCIIYFPGIGTHYFTVSSPLGRNSAFSHTMKNLTRMASTFLLMIYLVTYCWKCVL